MEHLCFILMFSITCVVHEDLLLLCPFVRFFKVFLLQLVTIYSVENYCMSRVVAHLPRRQFDFEHAVHECKGQSRSPVVQCLASWPR